MGLADFFSSQIPYPVICVVKRFPIFALCLLALVHAMAYHELVSWLKNIHPSQYNPWKVVNGQRFVVWQRKEVFACNVYAYQFPELGL